MVASAMRCNGIYKTIQASHEGWVLLGHQLHRQKADYDKAAITTDGKLAVESSVSIRSIGPKFYTTGGCKEHLVREPTVADRVLSVRRVLTCLQ